MAIKEFITKEDALSYLLGMGEAVEDLAVKDLAEAVAEKADVDVHNYVVDNPKKLGKSLLNGMANIADIRLELVSNYQNLIEDMLDQAEILEIKTKQQDSLTLIEYDSFAQWASEYLYMDLPLRNAPTLIPAQWKDVTLQIHDYYKLKVKIKNHKRLFYKTFSDLGLMAKNKYDPNHLGVILVGMANKKRYPPANEISENRHARNISQLNKYLKQMIPITDTSLSIKKSDVNGYLPTFKLIDCRNSRELRAKKDAKHDEFDEQKHSMPHDSFDDENDAAGKFLRDNYR